jgi:N-methylhydantoinase B
MDITTNQSGVDPVTLSVVWKRLLTITSEMGYRVMHSAQSYVMGMVQDLGPQFISTDGEILALVDFLPSHSLVAEIPSKHIIKTIGHMDPGDLVITNDSHIIQSGHLPDWTFFRPVYYKDELVCYAYLRGHQMDTGGALSGGYFPRAYDCISEGLNIPPLKIIRKGKVNEELYGLILRNVRNAAGVRADNMTIYGSLGKGEEALCEVIEKYGLDTVRACFKEMLRAGEEGMRAEIRKIPDGDYYGETAVDWDGSTYQPVWIRLKLTVKGDEMIFDYSESSPQVDFVNSPLGNTHCFTSLGLFLTMDPSIPHNSGAMRPITIIAPPGTVVNPTYPHTYGACACVCGTQICEVTLQALGKAAPDKAVGSWSHHFSPDNMGRYTRSDPRTGLTEEFFIAPFIEGGGTGGLKGFDGWEGYGGHTTGGALYRGSVEGAEMFAPYFYHTVRLEPDTEGPGEFTGATGCYCERMSDGDQVARDILMSGNSSGQLFPQMGQNGAPPAPLPSMHIQRAGKTRDDLEVFRCIDMTEVYPGDVLISWGTGGAGWGSPFDRDPEMVRADVDDMKVSIGRARSVYGVVMDPETLKVDFAATKKLRKELRDNPLYRDINLVMADVRAGKVSSQEAKDLYGVVVKEDRGHIVPDFMATEKLRPGY